MPPAFVAVTTKRVRTRKPIKLRASSEQQRYRQTAHQSNGAPLQDSWARYFQQLRDIHEVENTPFVDIQSTETPLPADDVDDKVRIFMWGGDSLASWIAEAEQVIDLCAGVNLESLKARERRKDGSNRIVAWLDERNVEGNARTRARPLTASELYFELAKPRFPSATSIGNVAEAYPSRVGQHSTPPLGADCAQSASDAYNADRRLLFITNLDRWTIYALVRTASVHQATALRGALPKYLDSKTFIQVTPMTKDREGFNLSFHLPYYVWRSSGTEQKDDRQYTDGTVLRQSQDVSFVHLKKNASAEYLYEAQVSCVIAGLDDWRWVAYCFSDTYFNFGADAEGEDILQGEEDGRTNGGYHSDPLIGTADDADKPIFNPREYFLRVFNARLAKITGEWRLVVRKMDESLREYDRGRRLSESIMRKSNSKARENFQALRRSFNHVIGVMDLSTQLSDRLSPTTTTVEKFLNENGAIFNVSPGLAKYHPLLVAIQTELQELQSLKNALEKVEKRWEQLARMLELNLNFEAISLAHDNKGLSMTMILYISPFALAASFFSMDPDVLPFRPNFKSFLGLLSLFISIAAIHFMVTWRSSWLLAMTEKMRLDLRVSALLMKLGRRRGTTTDEESRSH